MHEIMCLAVRQPHHGLGTQIGRHIEAQFATRFC